MIAGVAHGDLNYDFYGTGTPAGDAGLKFGLNQTGDVFFGEALRRTFWDMFIGPRIWFGTFKLVPQHVGENHPELPPLGVDFTMRSLGFKIERDTTPNASIRRNEPSFNSGATFSTRLLAELSPFKGTD